MADEQRSVTELHTSLKRRLKDLEAKEDRLIDVLADDALPQAKVRAKLRKIQADRASAEAGLANTSAEIAAGAGVLIEALDLVADPAVYYRDGNDTSGETLIRRFTSTSTSMSTGSRAAATILHSKISMRRSN